VPLFPTNQENREFLRVFDFSENGTNIQTFNNLSGYSIRRAVLDRWSHKDVISSGVVLDVEMMNVDNKQVLSAIQIGVGMNALICPKPQYEDHVEVTKLLFWCNQMHVPVYVFDQSAESRFFPLIHLTDL
jgi:hypothetical protein